MKVECFYDGITMSPNSFTELAFLQLLFGQVGTKGALDYEVLPDSEDKCDFKVKLTNVSPEPE